MTPDISQHNPDPAYLRGLIERAGLSQREAARRLGITDRVMRCYLAPLTAKSSLSAPYLVQYGLEQLALRLGPSTPLRDRAGTKKPAKCRGG